jgi:hypothetical protein
MFMGFNVKFADVLYMYKPQLGDEVFHLVCGDNSEDKFTKPNEMSHDMWHDKVVNLYNAWMMYSLAKQDALADSSQVRLKTDCHMHFAGSLAMFLGVKMDLSLVSRVAVPTTSWQHLLIEFTDRDALRITKPVNMELDVYLKLCLAFLHAWHKWQLADVSLAVALFLNHDRILEKEPKPTNAASSNSASSAVDLGAFKCVSTQSNLAKAADYQRQQVLAKAILSTVLSAKTLDQLVGYMQFKQTAPELRQTALYLEREILRVFEESFGVVLYQASNNCSADLERVQDEEDNARQILNIFGCLNVVDNRLTDLEKAAAKSYEATKDLRAMELTIDNRLVRLEAAAGTITQLEEKLDKVAKDLAENAIRDKQIEDASRQHGLNVLDLYEKYETVFFLAIALPIIACVVCWITDWLVK